MRRLLILISISFSLQVWAFTPRHVFTFHFTIDSEEYSLHVVVPHYQALPKNDFDDIIYDFLRASPGGNVSRAWRNTNIAEFLQNWVINHYRDIGLLPKDPESILSQALNRTSFFDISRSGAAFVTRRNSRKILALVRIDADVEGEDHLGVEKFCLEQGLKAAPFPRVVSNEYVARPEKNDFRLIHLPDGNFQFGMIRQNHGEPRLLHQRPPGAAAEMLNFNQVKGERDFLTLLYLAVDAFGLNKWSGRLTKPESGDPELVGIDMFYMHCEGEGRRKYFQALGWTVIDTYPNPHMKRPNGEPVANYVLAISRAGFKSTLEMAFTKRDGFVNYLFARFQLDESLLSQRRCQRILSSHAQHPNQIGPPLRENQPRQNPTPASQRRRNHRRS